MTIQDIQNILVIMEEKSINKAAARLYISQPALSKCLKKVEQEYDMVLFQRSQGSGLNLTPEGNLFRQFAIETVSSYDSFQNKLSKLKKNNENTIVFGTTIQRAYNLSGPLMRWIYTYYPTVNLEIRTMSSKELHSELLSGNLDFAMLGYYKENGALHYENVTQNNVFFYLRKGSTAGEKAVLMPGDEYPTIPLGELVKEPVVCAKEGSGTRALVSLIEDKIGTKFQIREENVYALRMAMVDAGLASVFTGDELANIGQGLDRSRLYCLPQELRIPIPVSLVCLKGKEKDKRFQMLLQSLQAYYNGKSS